MESDKADKQKLDQLADRAFSLRGQVLLLFDDYRVSTRSQENFITLNEDFIVELFNVYGVRFWAGNTLVLSIAGDNKLKPKFDFETDGGRVLRTDGCVRKAGR